MTNTAKNTGKRNRVIAASILSAIGIAGSLTLKSVALISEPTLIVFIAFSILSGLFIAFVERIESLSLRRLEVKLKEMRETEQSVKELGKAILEVIDTQSHGLMLESYDSEAAEAAFEKLKNLVS